MPYSFKREILHFQYVMGKFKEMLYEMRKMNPCKNIKVKTMYSNLKYENQ